MHLKSLTGKSPGYNDISFYVLKKCFSSLCEPLKYLLNLSIEKYIFPDDLKISKVTPIYKANGKSNLSNYKPIYVLLYFSKLLKRIMCNRLYQYLNEKIFLKQLEFQTRLSTEQATYNWLIKFLNLSKIINILWVFCWLIQSLWYSPSFNYFFKNCNYMVYS